MVDDRYGWLDEDVAERLLRGEPIDFADGTDASRAKCWSAEDRAAAERLAAVLAKAAEAGLPGENGRAPGEQAALAAFRAANTDTFPAPSAALGITPPDRFSSPGSPGGHDHRGHRADRSRPLERLRSLKVSVAVAVAACALGGVAVASSTGVLPAPSFMEDAGRSTPSVDVTSSEGPGKGGPGSNGEDSAGGRGDTHKGSKDTPGAGAPGTGDGAGSEGGTKGTPGAGQPGVDPEGKDAAKPQGTELDRLCREYTAAQQGGGPMPDRSSMRRLAREAGGADAVPDYCSRRLGNESSGNDPTQPAPTPTNPTGPADSTGGDDGDSDGAGDSGGTDGSNGGQDGTTSGGDGSADGGTSEGSLIDEGSADGGTAGDPAEDPAEDPAPEEPEPATTAS